MAELQIASVMCQGEKLLLTGKAEVEQEWDSEASGWINQLTRMTLVMDWNLTLEQIGSDQHIREAIHSGKALAVSDGSFQEQ